MQWKTGLPSKKPSLRLTVVGIEGRKKTFIYDVGYTQLVDLYNAFDKITIAEMGKFGEGRELEGSTEHQNILKFIEEKEIVISR